MTPAQAACNWTMNGSGAITATTCGIDGQSTEAYDYSAGTDDAANGAVLTIPNGVTVTVNSGQSGSNTTLLVGSISLTGTGSLVTSGSFIGLSSGSKCYVYDGDSDGYATSLTACSSTGGAGYVRKNKVSTTADCYDGNINVYPGQTTYYTTNRGDGSYDYNCDSVETKQYTTAPYSCAACTNGSGYASFQNTTSGFQTSTPACGTAGTYYTVTNTTCRDPAVANCSTSYSTSSVTQACR